MASVSKSICLVRSSVNIDETFQVPHIVRPGETISSSAMWARPGGKGANVAAVLGLAGVQVKMLGAVGSDATWPIDCLKERHVDTTDMYVSPDVPTGRAFIQISSEDGENSIVLLKGANFATNTPLDVPNAWFSRNEQQITHLVLQNEIPLACTIAFVEHAASLGNVCTVFNPSPMLTPDELRAFPWSGIRVLIVNQGEAADMHRALSGRDAGSEPAKALASLPAFASIQWIVVTRGSQGSCAGVLVGSERVWVDTQAAKTRTVVNTTGAGDTYTGYLVAGLMSLHERDSLSSERIKAIMHRASVASAMAVEVDGAMESIPSAKEVDARIALLG